MSQNPTQQVRTPTIPRAQNDALQAAIARHVAKSAQTVSRIPAQQRTILTRAEALRLNGSTIIRVNRV